MTNKEINKLVKQAAPRCGLNDSIEFGRYNVWLQNTQTRRVIIIRGQTKLELKDNLCKIALKQPYEEYTI